MTWLIMKHSVVWISSMIHTKNPYSKFIKQLSSRSLLFLNKLFQYGLPFIDLLDKGAEKSSSGSWKLQVHFLYLYYILYTQNTTHLHWVGITWWWKLVWVWPLEFPRKDTIWARCRYESDKTLWIKQSIQFYLFRW